MLGLFYVAAAVAVVATALALSRSNVLHGLLYLVVSLLAVALAFFALGAPFVAALEAIVYAGAIMVLFVFVVMMLGLAPLRTAAQPRGRSAPWLGPLLLAAVLGAELVGLLARPGPVLPAAAGVVTARQVGLALYGPYLVGVELSSMLLLGALVGANHLGRRHRIADTHDVHRGEETKHGGSDAAGVDVGDGAVRVGTVRTVAPAQSDLRPHVP